MKKYTVIFILIFCTGPLTGFSQSPNIIYINVDDLGYKDLGVMGSQYYETPNIDQLAREGMLFTQAYAAAANCAPSRACLLSGLNTPRHGIYTVGNSDRGNEKTRRIIPAANIEILPDSIYTLAEMLRDNGYITGTFGKWHLGEDPTNQGFKVNVGGSHRGNPGKGGYFSPYNLANLPDGPKGEFLTDRLTTEAISFLRANKKKPFFLYLPYYTVHTPIMGKDSLVAIFQQKEKGNGQDNPEYAAMIASLDENVGRLLLELQQLNLADQTIIIFTSDNGGIRDISYQNPLRAGKGSYYEGGIRVPLIIRWPGRIEKGSHSDVPVTNLDFYPTIQKIIQANPKNKLLDGVDISPVLSGKDVGERPLFWHFPVYLQAYNPKEDGGRDPLFRTRPGSVVRKGNWKLHEYFENGDIELYNLKEDSGETSNVADQYPEKAAELLFLLRQWREKVKGPVPKEVNPFYDSAFEQELTKKETL